MAATPPESMFPRPPPGFVDRVLGTDPGAGKNEPESPRNFNPAPQGRERIAVGGNPRSAFTPAIVVQPRSGGTATAANARARHALPMRVVGQFRCHRASTPPIVKISRCWKVGIKQFGRKGLAVRALTEPGSQPPFAIAATPIRHPTSVHRNRLWCGRSVLIRAASGTSIKRSEGASIVRNFPSERIFFSHSLG
jgi:hypothetical protein